MDNYREHTISCEPDLGLLPTKVVSNATKSAAANTNPKNTSIELLDEETHLLEYFPHERASSYLLI